MNRRRLIRTALVCSVLCLGAPAHSWQAPEEGQKRVLMIGAQRRGAAPMTEVETVFSQVLNAALASRLDFYVEHIDVDRFAEEQYQSAFGEFLRRKYEGLRIDLVIATTTSVIQLLEHSRPELFHDSPFVLMAEVPFQPTPKATGIYSGLDLRGTLDLALRLQPRTRHVFVIAGASESDHVYEKLARQQFQELEGRLAFTYFSGLSMSELQKRVANLPPDSVIYAASLFQDGAGNRFAATDFLDLLSPVANAPMYCWVEFALGHGIVGGDMLSPAILARRASEVVLRVLAGEKPENVPVTGVDSNVVVIDWRQLRRWHISEDNVPAGSQVRFREPSFLEQYKAYIVGTISLVCLQTALIVGLLVQRARRRRVEVQLRESEERFRNSHDEVKDLAGRLITAQEAERVRIARELHDDLGQRLAGFSIALSGLKGRVLADASGAMVVEALTALQKNAIIIANDMRHLSHELHPGVLQHAGLAAALKEYCAEIAAQHSITVTTDIGDHLGSLGADVDLCVYRVTQEALRNAARHGAARQAGVSLTRTAGTVELVITDDGVGFDAVEVRRLRSGLGLVSIDERARLVEGSLNIESEPGHGTRIEVSIPVPQPGPGEERS